MADQLELGKRNLIKITAIAGAGLAGSLILPSALAAKPRKERRKRKMK